jgi:hypothetical protein
LEEKEMIKNSIIAPLILGLLTISVLSVRAAELTIPVTEYAVISSQNESEGSKILFKFDLSGLPQGSYIDFAGLNFKLQADTLIGDMFEFEAFPLTMDWSASTINWNVLQSVLGDAYVDTMVSSGMLNQSERTDIYIDATDIVHAWVSGRLDNNGILLQGSVKVVEYPTLVSDDSFVNGAVAQLKIFYTPPEVQK